MRPHFFSCDDVFPNDGAEQLVAGLREREVSEDSTRSRSSTIYSCSSSLSSEEAVPSSELHCMTSLLCEDTRTTVILRNIPDDYTRAALLQTLITAGFGERIDFLYLPLNFGTNQIFGYAFINFVQPDDALRFLAHFQGFRAWASACSHAGAFVEWSGERQGLEGQIERYRNSGMMHKSIVDEAKPILLQRGVRVDFPEPTQAVKPLRVRAWKRKQAQCIDINEYCRETCITDKKV